MTQIPHARRPLWLATEIATATGGQLQGDFFVTGISNDTRSLEPGDLYIALSGRGNHDGHDFIANAFAAGANGVLLSKDPVDQSVCVADTFIAMQKLGAAARDRLLPNSKLVAITGSVGKTTTRALMAQALGVFGTVHASRDSLNNHWGVPLTLARMPKDIDYGVFEVGMNHAGEITPLTKQIRPHVAIITTIEAAHLEFFPDGLNGIARAKAEIFAGVEPGGAVVLNRDNPQFDLIAAEAAKQGIKHIITFGRSPEADLHLIHYERMEQGGRVTAILNGEEISFLLPIRGEHNALNALATLGAIYALGLSVPFAAAAFASMTDVTGRGNVSTITLPDQGTIILIDDRHNSSPVALNAAIREFAHMPVTGRRILALGDMLELGPQSPQLHAGIAPTILDNSIDYVLTCGPMMQHLADALPQDRVQHYANSEQLANDLLNHVTDGDALLVKGSRGAQMIRVVDALNSLSQT